MKFHCKSPRLCRHCLYCTNYKRVNSHFERKGRDASTTKTDCSDNVATVLISNWQLKNLLNLNPWFNRKPVNDSSAPIIHKIGGGGHCKPYAEYWTEKQQPTNKQRDGQTWPLVSAKCPREANEHFCKHLQLVEVILITLHREGTACQGAQTEINI